MVNVDMRVTGIDAIHVDSADDVAWHDQADVVVVGFGGAGASAAIHAACLRQKEAAHV